MSEKTESARDGAGGEPHELVGTDVTANEIVIGLVGAIGTNISSVSDAIADRFTRAGYTARAVRISKELIPYCREIVEARDGSQEFVRRMTLIDVGDSIRRKSRTNAILAYGAMRLINSDRAWNEGAPLPKHRHVVVVNSLKHQDEVVAFRRAYGDSFFLVGVYAEAKRRKARLQSKGLSPGEVKELMDLDKYGDGAHSQHVGKSFHLSDYFVGDSGCEDRLEAEVGRMCELLIGNPLLTPTPPEFAMHLAFMASLRSGDLSRQVGAVLTSGGEVIAVGANECPSFGGGQYWPIVSERTGEVKEVPGGRDMSRGNDANRGELLRLVDSVLDDLEVDVERRESAREKLLDGRLGDITEYGRVVHAEMAALLAASRMGVSTAGAVLYCTTFPCHNCAKHLLAAGVREVYFVEPYEKSKALELHPEALQIGAIATDDPDSRNRMRLFPFTGVGPRRFFELFSMHSGGENAVRRKDAQTGDVLEWDETVSAARLQEPFLSYLDLENLYSEYYDRVVNPIIPHGAHPGPESTDE